MLKIVKDVTNGKLAYAAFDAVVDDNTKVLLPCPWTYQKFLKCLSRAACDLSLTFDW